MKTENPDRLLTMREVQSILRYKGQGGLYRLINDDPDFVTFTVGGKRSRRMRESALRRWIAIQEDKAKAA